MCTRRLVMASYSQSNKGGFIECRIERLSFGPIHIKLLIKSLFDSEHRRYQIEHLHTDILSRKTFTYFCFLLTTTESLWHVEVVG